MEISLALSLFHCFSKKIKSQQNVKKEKYIRVHCNHIAENQLLNRKALKSVFFLKAKMKNSADFLTQMVKVNQC